MPVEVGIDNGTAAAANTTAVPPPSMASGMRSTAVWAPPELSSVADATGGTTKWVTQDVGTAQFDADPDFQTSLPAEAKLFQEAGAAYNGSATYAYECAVKHDVKIATRVRADTLTTEFSTGKVRVWLAAAGGGETTPFTDMAVADDMVELTRRSTGDVNAEVVRSQQTVKKMRTRFSAAPFPEKSGCFQVAAGAREKHLTPLAVVENREVAVQTLAGLFPDVSLRFHALDGDSAAPVARYTIMKYGTLRFSEIFFHANQTMSAEIESICAEAAEQCPEVTQTAWGHEGDASSHHSCEFKIKCIEAGYFLRGERMLKALGPCGVARVAQDAHHDKWER